MRAQKLNRRTRVTHQPAQAGIFSCQEKRRLAPPDGFRALDGGALGSGIRALHPSYGAYSAAVTTISTL
jgi:hypothetical protein